ncbi:hypothetical protein VX037_16575 [Gordonia sp. Z-3]|jgi:hypothetical protein|uniref:Uncharacterized protein n=2 Tax=Gordonia TaxID=2053 RepID=A0A9X3I2U4_9ACTN|nr:MULTISPECIES: hypothetical protein [Gordonia]MAU80569.1 hypothetical protein [Gordonia sp. (in: high G+C Gram-positive bacteria)]MCF3939737.1 hypothetical protein [Gordonia tangerina]MCX2962878.1 hypothetical protein [Gordonia aquimaris]MED5802646.1 hypothetical protein [Gordonia sp. Z-3]
MRASLKRAGAAVLATVGIAAGSLAGTAPAQAATPGDLQILGGIECHFGQWGQPWNQAWYMYRWMTVRNIGDTTMHNVILNEINGASVRVKELKPGESMSKWNGNRWVRPIETRWFGCFPSSISGFTFANEAENLTNNFGYWQNFRRMDNPGQQTPPTGS